MTSRLKNWRDRVSRGDLDRAELNADIEALATEAEQAEVEAQRHRELADQLREERESLVGLRSFLGSSDGSKAAAPTNPEPNRPLQRARVTTRAGSKRAAILSLLTDADRSLGTADILDALLEDGVVERNEGAYHALQVTLSQMYRDGQLTRPAMGVYELAREGAQQE